jgi:hypothetical protein
MTTDEPAEPAGPADDLAAKRFERLLGRSSLGTPGARALADRTPDEAVERILQRAQELEDEQGDAP